MKYPAPLLPGGRIAITAPSSGVPEALLKRLELSLQNLRERGFEVVEGKCLRGGTRHVSASASERADELMSFLVDESIAAIIPPWGGELAIELLPLLDYELITAAKPKWILGYSDITTILSAISAKCGWATAHGTNLMELIEGQTDHLTASTLSNLELKQGDEFVQSSSTLFQKSYVDFATHPHAPLNLTEPTQWKSLGSEDDVLQFSGRIFGGCLDILTDLAGSEYFDLSNQALVGKNESIILYLENVEIAPTGLARALYGMMFRLPTKRISGVLIGRNAAAPIDAQGYSDIDAIRSAFTKLPFPVVYDVDIGHFPPNMLVINGAMATVEYAAGYGKLTQALV